MIIAISGSVGSGKTSLAKKLASKLEGEFEVVHLNEMAQEFKLKDVKELQTFDFNIDKLIAKVNRMIADAGPKNMIFEGHFAHFINPDLVDFLFVVGRDLKGLKNEYGVRGYNEQKVKDNLEVESLNLCFYEGIEEGYKEEEQIFLVENSATLDELVLKVVRLVEKSGDK